MHTHVFTCIHTLATLLQIHACIHAFMYTHIHACIHVYMYTQIHACVHAYMYTHIANTYVYTHIHTHIHYRAAICRRSYDDAVAFWVYYCFTAAVVLLYYCFTTALLWLNYRAAICKRSYDDAVASCVRQVPVRITQRDLLNIKRDLLYIKRDLQYIKIDLLTLAYLDKGFTRPQTNVLDIAHIAHIALCHSHNRTHHTYQTLLPYHIHTTHYLHIDSMRL
jgi:hypothetical protein